MQKIESILHELSDLAKEFSELSLQSAAWLLLAAQPVFTTIHVYASHVVRDTVPRHPVTYTLWLLQVLEGSALAQ